MTSETETGKEGNQEQDREMRYPKKDEDLYHYLYFSAVNYERGCVQ